MKKWNMIVDVEQCTNCYNCFVATKDEHVGNDFPGYAAPQPAHGHAWVKLNTIERGQPPMIDANFMPTMCNHCDNPKCMEVAQDGAVIKRNDGIVIIDPVKSRGQKQIANACPYSAIYWNEDLQIPQMWIFDAHLIDQGWSKTRIEQACPTGALRSVRVSDEEMTRVAEHENLRVLKPEIGAKPRVYYKNLHLADTLFVGGVIVDDATDDYIEGATVELYCNEQRIASVESNCFGEFRFESVPAQTADCSIAVKKDDRRTGRDFQLTDNIYLGAINI